MKLVATAQAPRFGAIQIHAIDPTTKTLTLGLTDKDKDLNPHRDLDMPDTFEIQLPSNGSKDGTVPPSFTLRYLLPNTTNTKKSSVQFCLQSNEDIQRLTPLLTQMLPQKLTNKHQRVKDLLRQAGFNNKNMPNTLDAQSARVLAGHGRALFPGVKDAKGLNQTNRDFVEWHWLLQDFKRALD